MTDNECENSKTEAHNIQKHFKRKAWKIRQKPLLSDQSTFKKTLMMKSDYIINLLYILIVSTKIVNKKKY